ncbi:MAG: hypothetical protein ABJA75_21560, partial [Bradyrhizobium sp.]
MTIAGQEFGMRRWAPILDWDHLKNWLPGTIGVSAAILLIVIAANWPPQSTPKAETPQATTSVAEAQKNVPVATRPSASSGKPAVADIAAPAQKIAATVGVTPDHAEHAVARAPAKSPSAPENPQQQPVADATGVLGDAAAGRQVFKKCQACHSLESGRTV